MLIVGQRIDRGNLREFRELLDIALGKSADHCPMDHPAQDTGCVTDRFARVPAECRSH